ncbi:hypothetical protein C8J56DRAFT_280613 [Mycena floridula]|nr:hypothetical protein C8J56DRAFT_280613 [Mycena floridula]
MASAMSVDAPSHPKLVLDEFIAEALSGTPPELHRFFESFRTMHTRKLWHQLTLKLFEFFDQPLSKPFRVHVFERFVRDFEGKLNQLRLVEMGVKVSKELDNPKAQLKFLTSLRDRLSAEKSKEANIMLLSTIAHTKLIFGDLDGAKTDMDDAFKVLDDLDGVEKSVNASYYVVAADYYKAKGEYGPYYRNSLLYLACVDIEKDMTAEERMGTARNLAVAALLADSIFNFGELLVLPILDNLNNTEHEWIKRLLLVFNEGKIGKFEAMIPLLAQDRNLQESYDFLRQKICLMALIATVDENRTIDFQTISQATHLPYDEVEHLLMKALSLKLVRGSLDEVARKAHITWVQPRVLSREQIGGLAKRLEGWVNKLNGVEQRIGAEIVV